MPAPQLSCVMLAEQEIHLLTGYVDGELNARERGAGLRLLHESPEARERLLQFQENAHKVRQLPRYTLDDAFTAEVVQVIEARPVMLDQPRRSAGVRLRWLPYAGAAAAAAVLFVVTLSGALYLALRDGGDLGL